MGQAGKAHRCDWGLVVQDVRRKGMHSSDTSAWNCGHERPARLHAGGDPANPFCLSKAAAKLPSAM
eukprot:1150117-Pelagomonas_calceolata.AAC.9